jgi:hypothetical protein
VVRLADRVGVAVQVRKNVPTVGTIIVNNEIYNYGDAIGIGQMKGDTGGAPLDLTTGIPGTVIAENDLYVTPAYVESMNSGATGCIENAIDVKTGSMDPQNPVRIENNRLWGYRRVGSCSGAGEGIAIQCVTRHVVIRHNLIFDLPHGVRTEGWHTVANGPCTIPNPPASRFVTVLGNLFYGIVPFPTQFDDPEINGVITRLATENERFENNLFSQSATFLATAGVQGSATYLGNQFVAVANLGAGSTTAPFPPAEFNAQNQVFPPPVPASAVDYTFWIKRWTDPTPHTLPDAYILQ